MEKIIVLGTRAVTAISGYNTCFVLEDKNGGHFLVDTGGGNGIMRQLEYANIGVSSIHDIFISHKHSDHLLGILWVFREVNILMNKDKYDGVLNIYCHDEVASIIRMMVTSILRKSQYKHLDERVFIKIIHDEEIINVLDYKIEIMDIQAKSDKQYGFKVHLNNGKTLIFAGDEPLNEMIFDKVRCADYLLHEAYCLEAEAGKYKPYEKDHATVELACLKAEELNVKNLVLWHRHESLEESRNIQYQEAAKKVFNGKVYVPEDLDVIELD